MLAQEFRNLGLRNLTLRHAHDEVEEVSFRNAGLDAVQFEKDECSHGTNPLVAIHGGMIPQDARGTGGGELGHPGFGVCVKLPRARKR